MFLPTGYHFCTVRKVWHQYGSYHLFCSRIYTTKPKLSLIVWATYQYLSRDIYESSVVKSSWNLGDLLVSGEGNFFWFESVLQSRKSGRSHRALTPSKNITIIQDCECLLPTAGDLVDSSLRRYALNQYWRVFEVNWLSNTQLPMLVWAHRVGEIVF